MRSCYWLRGRFVLAMLKAYRFVLLVLFALLRSAAKNAPSQGAFFYALVQILPLSIIKGSFFNEPFEWLRGQDLNHTTFGLWARRADQTAPPRDGTLDIILFYEERCQGENEDFWHFFGFFQENPAPSGEAAGFVREDRVRVCRYFFSIVKPAW